MMKLDGANVFLVEMPKPEIRRDESHLAELDSESNFAVKALPPDGAVATAHGARLHKYSGAQR